MIRRITIELEQDKGADELEPILNAIAAKLSRCWATTTMGPVEDQSGRHVANAKVELVAITLQMALESAQPVDADDAAEALEDFNYVGSRHHY